MIISYKGETLDTKYYRNMSDEKFVELRNAYYKKPDFVDVEKQFLNIKNGGIKNDKITNYYVKDLMAKTKIYYNKWSIEDVFNCKDLLCRFYGQIELNKKVFPENKTEIENIETAIRLGGKGVASKPANFPIKTIDEILQKYNINNNYYDFSCGWGARLTGALKNNVNYFGTDPNYLLVDRLNALQRDYKKVTGCQSFVDIRAHGSEIFVKDWENKIGLAFSSPPYFYLEDYKIGEQSYKEGCSYEDWKNNYLKPTFENIYKYLVIGGIFALNINNFLTFDLISDSIDLARKIGFIVYDEYKLENIKRVKSSGGFNDNSERIIIFKKVW